MAAFSLSVLTFFSCALPPSKASTTSGKSRRCIEAELWNAPSNATSNILSLLHENTTCLSPSTAIKKDLRDAQISSSSDPYHIVMMLSDDNPRENRQDMVTLAAGLLTKGMNVTVLFFSNLTFPDELENGFDGAATVSKSLREDILIHIPFSSEMIAKQALIVEILPINIDSNEDRSSCFVAGHHHPMDKCARGRAPKVLEALKVWHTNQHQEHSLHLPDAVIMDVSFLGGQLFAESNRIPMVTLGSYHSLPLAVEHDPSWQPASKWGLFYRMYRILQQRVYSLSLTQEFLAMNQLRQSLFLSRLKSPHDCLSMTAVVLTDFFTKDFALEHNIKHNGNDAAATQPTDIGSSLIFNYSPLLPPCIPCMHQQSTLHRQTKITDHPIILVVSPSDFTSEWTRNLIRGMILARQSLQTYDTCSWDSFSCINPFSEFHVLWLEQEFDDATFPPVVPEFIQKQESNTNLIDTIVQNPSTVVAIMTCDADSQAAAGAMLGVSILCLKQDQHRIPLLPSPEAHLDKSRSVQHAGFRMFQVLPEQYGKPLDPTSIATQIIHTLRQRVLYSTKQNDTDTAVEQRSDSGLERVMSIVEALAKTQRQNQPWDNLDEMRRAMSNTFDMTLRVFNPETIEGKSHVLQAELEVNPFLQRPYDSFTVFVAWFVLLSAALYLAFKDTIMLRVRQHIHQHPFHLRQPTVARRDGGVSDGILSRLSDLDDAWQLLLEWYQEQPTFALVEKFSGNNGVAGREQLGTSPRQHHATQHGPQTAKRRRKGRPRQP